MTRATTSGQVVHAREEAPRRCIALGGKGIPGSADLEGAIEAVRRAVRAVRELTRRRGHEWKPAEPEVRLRTPTGERGGPGWIVRVAVPPFVTARDVRAAVEDGAGRQALAKNIRLVPLALEPSASPARPGRDRLPGQLRHTRAGGAPQHRARDLR
jgi:hypothetical protein